MKKQLLSSVFLLAVASNALALTLTFSDADRFASLPAGPAGITLTAGGPVASVSGSFDLVNPDGTSSFTIGSPYAYSQTYSSVLGFIPGLYNIVEDDSNVTLFLRDPGGSTESAVYTASTHIISQGSFTTAVIISQSITASIITSLSATGSFNYTVTATSGSFIIDAAYLEVKATVPDGGSTVALLGSALMVGAFFRRKFLLA